MLKDSHGGCTVRVRGHEKVFLHLMFGILVNPRRVPAVDGFHLPLEPDRQYDTVRVRVRLREIDGRAVREVAAAPD